MGRALTALLLIVLVVVFWKVILFLIAAAFVLYVLCALLFSDMDDPCCDRSGDTI